MVIDYFKQLIKLDGDKFKHISDAIENLIETKKGEIDNIQFLESEVNSLKSFTFHYKRVTVLSMKR